MQVFNGAAASVCKATRGLSSGFPSQGRSTYTFTQVFGVVQLLVSARPPEGLLLGSLVLVLVGALAPLI